MNKTIPMSGLLVLAASATLLTPVLACEEHAKAEPTATQAPSAAVAPVGLTAVRDAETGQLRAPTADEAKALAKVAQRQFNAEAARVGQLRAANPYFTTSSGAKGMRLSEEHMSYSVVRRNADGSLSTDCVEGKQKADAVTLSKAKESTHE